MHCPHRPEILSIQLQKGEEKGGGYEYGEYKREPRKGRSRGDSKRRNRNEIMTGEGEK